MASSGSLSLRLNHHPPRLYVTADEDDFDPTLLQHFRDERFDATYLPWRGGGKAYKTELAHLSDDLERGESYAIVAFASAAADCLEFHIEHERNFVALIAYYPTEIPSPTTRYPPQLEVLCHIAGSQPFAPAFNSYTYLNTRPGFAEHDLDEYESVAASLSWTRTLGTLRRAFKLDYHTQHLEQVRERQINATYFIRDAASAVQGFREDGYLNHVPTTTGGIGHRELLSFYHDKYIATSPSDLTMELVSRTAGTDRVIDEFVLRFKHTQEMPWILSGVRPTNKDVSIAMVSIVRVRGGKICSEHVYWDQASVLMQVGLLDPKAVPADFQEKGLERLPICGAEASEKVLGEKNLVEDRQIPKWE